jgi:glycosyltransferase involved in cell wall biosynthesis
VTDLSLVIPCYNESANLSRLVDTVARSIPDDFSMEVIFVDNGSTDGSARIVADLLARHSFAVAVSVPVNKGYGFGLMAGLKRATGSVVGWTHADLQTDPADVVNGYRAFGTQLRDGRVVLKGRRGGRPLVDRVFTAGMSLVASLALGGRFSDVNGQPKLFSRRLLEEMDAAPSDFSFDLYLLWLAGQNGYAIVDYPVTYGQRTGGEAKGGGSLRLKWKMMRRTVTFIRDLRHQIRSETR